jgi:hypothetical protein
MLAIVPTIALCGQCRQASSMLGLRREEAMKESHEVLSWAVQQKVAPASAVRLNLPPTWSARSGHGAVQVGRTQDGRTCLLVIKHVGWKDNFDGVVACDGPLTAAELPKMEDRTYISLPGLGVFEELDVAKRWSDRDFEVFFDLN